MAQKRMFSLKIIDTDIFLDMPNSTQLLYFHLAMRADDDGFIASPKKIQRMTGCSDDDMKILIGKQLIIPFESGICVIKHWRVHNYIAKDRYSPTFYGYEKSLLTEEDGTYEIGLHTECIQNVDKMYPQVRLEKGLEKGLEKEKELEKEESKKRTAFSTDVYIHEKQFSPLLEEKVIEWITYKKERRDGYKETGLKSLCTQIEKKAKEYGETAVCNLVTECMSNGWKGIIWDRLKNQQSKSSNPFLEIAMGDDTF